MALSFHKILLHTCLLYFSVFAGNTLAQEVRVNLTPYTTILGYSEDSFRDSGYVNGVYGKVNTPNDNHAIELAVEQTSISYDIGTKLRQWDITALYSKTLSDRRFNGSVGAHFVQSGDEFNDQGATLITDINYTIPLSKVGTSAFLSQYDRYDAFQLTPYTTFDVGSFFLNLPGKTTLEPRLYWIYGRHHREDATNDFSMQVSLTHLYRNIQWQAFGWKGIQRYAVKERGFLVINTNEKHTGGLGATFDLFINNQLSFRASHSGEYVREFRNTTRHSSTLFSLSYQF